VKFVLIAIKTSSGSQLLLTCKLMDEKIFVVRIFPGSGRETATITGTDAHGEDLSYSNVSRRRSSARMAKLPRLYFYVGNFSR